MVVAARSYTWNKSVLHTAEGFEPTALSVLLGAIPAGLKGSLYRNGPGRLERGGVRVGHWFDGDGAILGVHFNNAKATGVYRYVESPEFLDEEREGRLIYSGYGMLPPGNLIDRFTKGLKNAANTSVLAFDDRLLALWEGGHPYALDLDTLATTGLDDLGGLPKDLPFSAHPKRDNDSGDLYNFGVSFGKDTVLNLYCIDAKGRLKQRESHAIDGSPLIHDFVMAGPYLLFFISPVRLNPLLLLTRLKPFSDSFDWKPELGTQVLVFDRATLKLVSQGTTEPWYQWHFGNGFVDTDGNVVVDVIRHEDFNTNEYLREISTGTTVTSATALLWQVRINPLTGKVLELVQMLDRACEFPIVKPTDVGQEWQHTYLTLHRRGADTTHDYFGAIGRFDRQTGTLIEADLGEQRYAMEPIYAPDAIDQNRGWILTVVYDGTLDQSEVWIFDSDRLDAGPVCRLALPEVIPIGFHGTWKAG